MLFFFFFFQAEDGIRDADVTGVQTCALPIYLKAAANGENEEWSELYPAFAKVADEEGFTEIANAFRMIAKAEDRKSTRLNSSHVRISYAVFCLKKKNIKDIIKYGVNL